ncbi:STAS domain-containing protein [Brevibacillus dissolubilis]|uniref:STAS domain-containing protein n=1 Tax=Brevibacillus dissolubilis TaxID=1844116 RepID=UPI00159BA7B3|nr:STAS domain-containing protein [Brevibacillus dissolubilis]
MNKPVGPFEITIQESDGFTVIQLKGKFIYGQTDTARQKLNELDITSNGYIFDLSQLSFIDSTGIGTLIHFSKRVGTKKIAILVLDPLILQLFTISKLHLIFPLVSTHDEAVRKIKDGYQTPFTFDE